MASERRDHVLMLPHLAHGHLIPFLGLAKRIQEISGFAITIASTHLNIQYLKSTVSSASVSSSSIVFAELPFSVTDHRIPPNTESTENLSIDEIGIFFHSTSSLEDPVRSLVADIVRTEGKPPVCIISDVFFGWATQVARSFGTRNIAFTTGGAYGTLAYVSLWIHLPHRETTSDEFSIPGFPPNIKFHRSHLHKYLNAADGTDTWSAYFQPQISLSLDSDGWLCNSVEEIEPLGLEMLSKYVKTPVWTIGPLLPPEALKRSPSNSSTGVSNFAGKRAGVPAEKCIEWLNYHDSNSVLYISFGSQNTIGETQMMELAYGLEESGKPFIWVVRPPLGSDLKGEFRAHQWLPPGFEERITERKQGLLIRQWAPQLEILGHNSTGAFLSHCGWNSVLESLSQGVPLIGWPMAAEQGYNSKMLVEEMGVSVELTRGVQKEIQREKVKKVVEFVLDKNGGGEEMRKKAEKAKEQIRAAVREEGGEENGSSVRAVDDFVKFVQSKDQASSTSFSTS